MAYTLTEEDRLVLEEIKLDIIKLFYEIKSIGIALFWTLYRAAHKYLSNLTDYQLENIRKKGLGEVLYERALRFFGLQICGQKKRTPKQQKHSNKPNALEKKRIVSTICKLNLKRILCVLLLPIYLMICFLHYLRRKKRKFVKITQR